MNEPMNEGASVEGKARLYVAHGVVEGLEAIWDLLMLVLGVLL